MQGAANHLGNVVAMPDNTGMQKPVINIAITGIDGCENHATLPGLGTFDDQYRAGTET
ncbi:hypothetical protein FQZ97_825760 [compost metagenome]